MQRDGTMALGLAVLPGGIHTAGWRIPGAAADGGVNIDRYIETAKAAEAAKLDFIFLPDGVGIRTGERLNNLRYSPQVVHLEPLTTLAAVAVHTTKIGLVGTASTTFSEPYNLARMFASLDLISKGRAGWNLVTSAQDSEARNFNLERLPPHGERYKRAAEFADVANALWDSWEDGALLMNQESGEFIDTRKAHYIDYDGAYFKVRGPLNVPRPVQGRPVLVQAGSSDDGKELAAATAEVIFTAQRDKAAAKKFYDDVKSRARELGRKETEIKILPGVQVIVGKTEAEARSKHQQLLESINTPMAMAMLSTIIGGIDLTEFPIDGPIPDLPLTEGPQSRFHLMLETGRKQNMTLGQLALTAAETQGHGAVVGSIEQVADHMQDWYESEVADGFTFLLATLPESLSDVARYLLPELRRRRMFREEYTGNTLRDHLGLSVPKGRFVSKN